jgi:hypothetical protein
MEGTASVARAKRIGTGLAFIGMPPAFVFAFAVARAHRQAHAPVSFA